MLTAFKSAVHSSGHLSKKAKLILMKNPWQRKEDEMKVCQLKVLVNNTPDSENRYQRALLVTKKVFFCVSDIKNKALFKFI